MATTIKSANTIDVIFIVVGFCFGFRVWMFYVSLLIVKFSISF